MKKEPNPEVLNAQALMFTNPLPQPETQVAAMTPLEGVSDGGAW